MLFGGKNSALILFVLLLACLSYAAPCGHAGDPCASDANCCTGIAICNTAMGVCTPPPCAIDGNSCTSNAQCCSLSCSSGTCTAQSGGGGTVDPYGGLLAWLALAVALAAAFLGLAYMAAKMLELQLLDAWVKIELSELVTAILIAVFCIALIATVNAAAQFLSGENGDVVSLARGFLKGTLYADGKLLYNKIAIVYFELARTASFSYTAGTSIEIASISMSESPGAGLSGLVSEVGQGMDSVSNFMLLAAAQSAFLLFFQTASIVMLPVGIFLRCFSLTRKTGAVVLAAVIASAVIYPAAVLLAGEVYTPLSLGNGGLLNRINKIGVTGSENPPLTKVICDPLVQRFVQSPIPFLGGEMGWWITICSIPCAFATVGWAACMQSCQPWIFTAFYIAKATFPIIGYFILHGFSSKFGDVQAMTDRFYDPIVNNALPAVSEYAILSIVVFLIPVIISIVMLRNFAIIFGGEPQLYGISKLV